MKKMIYEILAEVSKLEPEQRVSALQSYGANTPMLDYLHIAYNKKIEWNLPEGTPPYRVSPVPVGMGDTNLYRELRRVKKFIKGSVEEYELPSLKKETIFIGILEGLEKDEAKFLEAVKNKEVEVLYPLITGKLLLEAFPTLLN